MRSCRQWSYLVTGLAVAFVGGSAIALAIRQGSWGPVISVGWLPAVVVAVRPSARRPCLSLLRRREPVR